MRILINIPDELLEALDKRCGEEERSRSQIVRMAIKSYLEDGPETPTNSKAAISNVRCEMPYCKSPANGFYEVAAEDVTEGTIRKQWHLCAYHVATAKREGEVTELE